MGILFLTTIDFGTFLSLSLGIYRSTTWQHCLEGKEQSTYHSRQNIGKLPILGRLGETRPVPHDIE